MTTIEKIKQAREEMQSAFEAMRDCGDSMGIAGAFELNLEVLQQKVSALVWLQAEAIVQATEVADENFARAQKLSDQVQENVRHIERLAERRSDEDRRIVEAMEKVAHRVETFVEAERAMPLETLQICRDKLTIALALAKGEAV
jgi:hypothetical protein